MGRPHKCPWCQTPGNSVSKGVRKTKTMGHRRIRLCKVCGKKFTPKNQQPITPNEENTPHVQTEPDVGLAQVPERLLPPPDKEWTS